MRYSVKQCAAALVAALRQKPDSEQKKTVRRFLFLLRKHGLWQRRMFILKEAERQYLRERNASKVVIASAAPVAPKTRQEIKRIVGRNAFWQETIEPGLLAGLKILINDEMLIDATGKRQVERMF